MIPGPDHSRRILSLCMALRMWVPGVTITVTKQETKMIYVSQSVRGANVREKETNDTHEKKQCM